MLSEQGVTRRGGPAGLAGTAYFAVWALLGAVMYVPSVLLSTGETQSIALARLAPCATGITLPGQVAFSYLHGKCTSSIAIWDRGSWARTIYQALAQSAAQCDLRLGRHCCLGWSGLTLVLLVTGLLDLGMMAVLAIAIVREQLTPAPLRVARVIAILTGISIFAQARR